MASHVAVGEEVADDLQVAGGLLGVTPGKAKEEMYVGKEGIWSARLLDMSDLNQTLYPILFMDHIIREGIDDI